MPIRIMHVLDNMGRGGMQNGLVNLIAHLDADRFQHIVCTTRFLEREEAHQFPDRVRVICVGDNSAKGSRFQFRALARSMRELKPEIVHSRNWGGAEAVLAGRWVCRPALIHSEHGLDPETVDTEPWRRIAFRRLAFELAQQVVCVSDHLRRLYSRRVRFPERRMKVIHNGVDPGKFSPDPQKRAAMRQRLGIGGDEFCIGCVGRLAPIKDYPTMIRAAAEFGRTVSNWRLIIVGEGPERANLERLVGAQPELRQRILFSGLSTHISEILNAMDLYVLPSIAEGISNSLLEAMATGLPSLVTSTGGNPEVVVDGESGILFPVGAAELLARHVMDLYASAERRHKLGTQAMQRMHAHFSLEAMVRNYERLYEGAVKQPKTQLAEVACI